MKSVSCLKKMELFNENLGSELPKHKCHVCDEFFDQYSLEIHYLTCHTLEDEELSQEYKYDLNTQIHEVVKSHKLM